MKPAPKPRPDSVPRHRLFVAVRSGARTGQIGRSAVILRKTPSTFWKSTRLQRPSQNILQKTVSDYFEINPASLFPLLSVTLSCKLPQPRSRLSPAAAASLSLPQPYRVRRRLSRPRLSSSQCSDSRARRR